MKIKEIRRLLSKYDFEIVRTYGHGTQPEAYVYVRLRYPISDELMTKRLDALYQDMWEEHELGGTDIFVRIAGRPYQDLEALGHDQEEA